MTNVEGEIGAAAHALAREFLDRPLFCQLLGMVASILEHNLSSEAIASSRGR